MSLSRIVMRLARNPGTAFAEGDDHRGYTLTAPLTSDGQIDEAAFRADTKACTVRRFSADEDAQEGVLSRRGERWFFDYDAEDTADDEAIHKLGDHSFNVGDYVSIADPDGLMLAYKVTEVTAL